MRSGCGITRCCCSSRRHNVVVAWIVWGLMICQSIDTAASFAAVIVSTQSIRRSPVGSISLSLVEKKHHSCWGGSRNRTRNTASATASVTPLRALPASLWWILGHEILGAAPVPFIASATKEDGWLRKIERPTWNPPDRLFGPVWTFLYATMGLAVSRIYHSSKLSSTTKTPLLLLWAVHFALNVSWAPTFFSLQRFRPALIISSLMVVTLLAIIPLFYSVNPTAGLLLLPYLAWITFATVLNRELCRLNPTVNGLNNGMLQAQLQKLRREAATYADS